jgi:hypothetical protein
VGFANGRWEMLLKAIAQALVSIFMWFQRSLIWILMELALSFKDLNVTQAQFRSKWCDKGHVNLSLIRQLYFFLIFDTTQFDLDFDVTHAKWGFQTDVTKTEFRHRFWFYSGSVSLYFYLTHIQFCLDIDKTQVYCIPNCSLITRVEYQEYTFDVSYAWFGVPRLSYKWISM